MWLQVKISQSHSDKRGVSIMVGYVLLVTSAIIMSVIVYQWIKTYVPTEALECPNGVSVFLKKYVYNCGLEELNITLKNNGRFNLAGYFIHVTNKSDQELATIDLSIYTEKGEGKGGTVLFGTKNLFEPGGEMTNVFDLSDSNIGQIHSVEIIPVRFQEEEGKTRFASCGNAKVEEIINCGKGEGECTPNCIGKECGSDGCEGSCGSCEGEYVCNGEGECISEEQCTDTCNSLGYDCGTWTICGEETSCGSCEGGYFCNDEGECEEECITHSYSQCYDGDVYWYDSCDVREDKKDECDTSGYTGENYCYDGDVYRDYITRECSDSGPECTSSTERIKQDECGVMGCRNGECRTVICTELYNLGYLTEEEYQIELKYGATHFSSEAMRGYHAFAIPAVKAMRKRPETIINILPLVKSFTEEMAYRLGKKETGNEVGAIFLDKGLPLFERIGVLINEPDWKQLFYENYQDKINFISQNEKYDKLVKNYFTEEKIKEMFYDALERSEGSDILFAYNLLENLEKAVEEIELKVSLLRHPNLLLI